MPQALDIMLSIVRDGGRIALRMMDDCRPELKADASVVTRADMAVSTLAQERLKPFLKTGAHLLIDEETVVRTGSPQDVLSRDVPYIWALDPIDGTRPYANRMPQYAVSLGLMKDHKPWLGAVYFPTMRELFYCDGTDAWFVSNPFGFGARRVRITGVDETISSRSVFIATDEVVEKFAWRSQDCRLMIFASAVSEFCWPSIGRGCGSLSRVYVWDLAGSWPVVGRAGLTFRSIKTGLPLERLEPAMFDASWRLKEHYILSSERNFPLLRDKLKVL